MKKHIFLIKFGGSIITDKDKEYTPNLGDIRNLSKQLKNTKGLVILAHGSGSFGHTSAKKYGGTKGYKSRYGIAKVARDAMEINRIVMDSLIEQKIPAVSLRPGSMMIAQKGKLEKSFFEVIEILLRQGIIPVVYGDVIWDKSWKSTIFSGETVLNKISSYLVKKGYKIKADIQVGTTDGVYDKDGRTIPVIDKKNWVAIKPGIEKVSYDVTGGMVHKIENSLDLAKKGITTIIINGTRKNSLKNILTGKKVNNVTVIK